MIIWVVKFFFFFFLYSSSVYSCYLLTSSASVRSIPFLSFIVPIFTWNVQHSSLSHSIVFLNFFTWITDWLTKAFFSLLVILWNSSFKWVYLSFSPLLSTSLLFTAICKVSSNSQFAFFSFLFLGDGLDPCLLIMSQTSVHSSSGTLSIRSNPLNLFVTYTV